MNRTRVALFLLLTSTWLGAAGHPARAAQLVALTPDEELYADIFANYPAVAAQPDGSYVIAWDDDTFSSIDGSFSYRYTPAGEDIGTGDYYSIYSPTGAPSVDAVGTPQGPPVSVTSDDTTEPRGGGLAWTGDSWLAAWVAAIFPYDQSAVFVRRFAIR